MKSHFPKCHMVIIIIKSMEELLSVCRPCSVPFAKSQSWETWPVKTVQEVLLSPNTLDTVATFFWLARCIFFWHRHKSEHSWHIHCDDLQALFAALHPVRDILVVFFLWFYLFLFLFCQSKNKQTCRLWCFMSHEMCGKCRRNGIWKLRLI